MEKGFDEKVSWKSSSSAQTRLKDKKCKKCFMFSIYIQSQSSTFRFWPDSHEYLGVEEDESENRNCNSQQKPGPVCVVSEIYSFENELVLHEIS